MSARGAAGVRGPGLRVGGARESAAPGAARRPTERFASERAGPGRCGARARRPGICDHRSSCGQSPSAAPGDVPFQRREHCQWAGRPDRVVGRLRARRFARADGRGFPTSGHDEVYLGGFEEGLKGGRARGKKVMCAVAVEVRARGSDRRRLAILEDASKWSSLALPCMTRSSVSNACSTALRDQRSAPSRSRSASANRAGPDASSGW